MLLISLISLALLGAFSLLYVSKSLAKKPPFVEKAVQKISENIKLLSFWGVIFGLGGIALDLLMIKDMKMLLIAVVSDSLIIVMALPYSYDRFADMLKNKLNPVFLEESKGIIATIQSKEKYIGYAGAICTFLLFAIIFQ